MIGLLMRCCTGDGGAGCSGWWASVVALQREVANHRKVRWSRTGVLSVVGNGAPLSASGVGQEGERE